MNKYKADPSVPKADLPGVIGHQGMRNNAVPGNSIAAFKAAKDAGCEWVELDVMLTKDGKPVLIHENNVKSSTNGTGSVEDMPLEQLRMLKLPNGEPIPTFEEALDTIGKLGLNVNVEIKPSSPGKAVATAKKAAIVMKEKGFDTANNAFVSSFTPAALSTFRALAPQIPRGLLQRVRNINTFKNAANAGCSTITYNRLFLTSGTVKKTMQRGFDVGSYTVNNTKRARKLWNLGVKSIFTDKPAEMIKELDKHKAATKARQIAMAQKSRS